MSAQLTLIAQIKPRPEHLDAARAAVVAVIDLTRAEPGCLQYRLNEDHATGTLHLYEEWRDDAALAAHLEQPYIKALFVAVQPWLAEPPQMLRLRPVK